MFISFEEPEESYGGWGELMIDAAIIAVPMAIILAAMPTGLFTIPIVGLVTNLLNIMV